MFDLFDLFFEELLTYFSIESIFRTWWKLPKREKKIWNIQFCNERYIFSDIKKKKEKKKERNRRDGIYLPFTMVLVKMLSPKLSCTAKLSPCMYCRDAHPGTEWKDNSVKRLFPFESFTDTQGISVTWHPFIVSFRRLLCFLVAAFYYVQLNYTMLTWSL